MELPLPEYRNGPDEEPELWEGRTCIECRFCGAVYPKCEHFVCLFEVMTDEREPAGASFVEPLSEACEGFEPNEI